MAREDRDYLTRARWPLRLFWVGVVLVNVPNLARFVGVDLPVAAMTALLVVGGPMAVIGFVQSQRIRRRGR
jgi:hypothetical protein